MSRKSVTNLPTLETYTAALTAGHIDCAVKVALKMTSSAKDTARNIWASWGCMTVVHNLPTCPF